MMHWSELSATSEAWALQPARAPAAMSSEAAPIRSLRRTG